MKPRRALPPLAVAASLACALLVVGPSPLHASPLPGAPALVPTRACSCAPLAAGGPPRFGIRSPPIYHNYDEQVGVTFTQSFTSLEYNVTAMPQTDPALGTGPAYLVNGLSNEGYWYQVGVSWDWAPGDTLGTGLAMSYEVFDTHGNSVYPTDGQGGLQAFSGPVNPGDIVLLDLYFSNSSGEVVMQAYDATTGASASEAYPAFGATYFVGLPDSVANSNGFFTGLMTEWYHGLPYFADEAPAAYVASGSAPTSAWMWMDEFNASNYTPIFASNTTAPVSLSARPLQGFSYNGTTEYADSTEFVTGALQDPAAAAYGVPLVLSYRVRGGAAGWSPPELSYVSGGEAESVQLTGEPTLYFPDRGTGWSVAPALGGSNDTVRWATDKKATGVASSPASAILEYYSQALVNFGFTVDGGGSGYSPPTVNYTSFGEASTAAAGEGVWADFGGSYKYQSPLSGSTGVERWSTESVGTVSRPGELDGVYYHQYLVTFDVSFRDTAIIPALSVESVSAGKPYSAGVVPGANSMWLDAGAAYSLPATLPFGTGQRFLLNGTSSGDVSGSTTVRVVYEHQFYEEVAGAAPAGGIVTPAAGWYDSGTVLQLGAGPSQGWQFEGWEGAGPGSVSGLQPSLALTVGPAAPSNETAVFYPGVEISAHGPSSVSYADGRVSGTVPSGGVETVYVPPGTMLTIKGSSVPPWTTFSGWSGAVNASSSAATVYVAGPLSVTASSGYDTLGVAGSLILLAAGAWAAVAVWRRRAGRTPRTPAVSGVS